MAHRRQTDALFINAAQICAANAAPGETPIATLLDAFFAFLDEKTDFFVDAERAGDGGAGGAGKDDAGSSGGEGGEGGDDGDGERRRRGAVEGGERRGEGAGDGGGGETARGGAASANAGDADGEK
jgi:hypothetical protein